MNFLIISLIFFPFFLVMVFLISRLLGDILALSFWGAIYVPTKLKKIERMIEIARIKSGERAADLGAGDGRIVIALAKLGLEAHGYEINPLLVLLAKQNIRKAGVEEKTFIHWKNFWKESFSNFDVITIYGIHHIMKRLEIKLKKELRTGTRVVSNGFIFPTWPPSKKEDNIYLYIK